MTALDDTWAESDRTDNPDLVAMLVSYRQHEGYGLGERQPCWCRSCDGIVPHPLPFSALEAAARMTAID